MQEIEATLRQSAQSTKGLMEAARILSTLKMATSQTQSQNTAEHASNTAFAKGVAQRAEQRLQDSSERHQQHLHISTAKHRQNAGTCHAVPACMPHFICCTSCIQFLCTLQVQTSSWWHSDGAMPDICI